MSPRAGLDTNTLVMAAAEIADKDGIEAVTLAALAARLGVRSPSLYNHINGLTDLRTLLAIHGLEQLYSAIYSASRETRGDAAVHAMGRAYLEFAKQRPGLYETTLRAPEQGDAKVEKASDQILSLIIHILSEYELGQEGEIHAVRGLRSLLHGFASLENKGGFGIPLNTSDSFNRLINTFIAGINSMRSSAN